MFAALAVQTTFLTMLQFNKLRKGLSWPIFLFLSVFINRLQNNIIKHVRTYKFPLYHFQVVVTFLPDSAQNNLESRYFFQDATTPGGPGPPDYQSVTITHTHTPLGRTSLDERSARRRDLYLTTNKSQQTNINDSGGIGTRSPSMTASADPRLGPRGHCNRQFKKLSTLAHILVLSFPINRNKNFLEWVRTYEFPSRISLSSNGLSLT